MKRGQPLQRKTPLRSDPEKTAAFVQRGRGKLKAATAPGDFRDDEGRAVIRTVRDAPRGLRAGERKRPVSVPAGARKAAYARTHGACVMCLYKQGLDVHAVSAATVRALIRVGAVARAVQVHHICPQGKWPHLAKLAANLTGVCPGCHDEHERAHRRLPRSVLPPEVIALAEAEGLTWYIERVYPAAAA